MAFCCLSGPLQNMLFCAVLKWAKSEIPHMPLFSQIESGARLVPVLKWCQPGAHKEPVCFSTGQPEPISPQPASVKHDGVTVCVCVAWVCERLPLKHNNREMLLTILTCFKCIPSMLPNDMIWYILEVVLLWDIWLSLNTERQLSRSF